MSKRYYQPKPASWDISNGVSTLPTNQPIAVYYRQSTDAQVGNISTDIQTIDMKAYLRQRGWQEDDIVMIDMDEGVSGTKKIDERDGMRTLFSLITEGKIRAVACQDEDRLFRDITQIQVNIFIEACRTANVLVLTPNMVYDFANELTGSFHARQFRFKCEMAADYINTVILGKLNRAKRRLLMEGRWAGFNVVPGYMVDTRKELPDGSKNPNWRRYVPFPEYADVVNEYFRLFVSYAGNVHATIKHIHTYGPYYPDPSECPLPDGFKFITRMKRYGHGYCPARNGLVNLLTNATLIGHWAVNGVIVRWNNHPPIVEDELFWRAFNYLSSTGLDGRANPHYRPFAQQARPSLEKSRSKERPLCAGMIVAPYEGKWKNVGTVWIKGRQEYIYMHSARYPHEVILWRRNAHFIDQAIVDLVQQKLQATFAPETWDTTIAHALAEYEEGKRRIRTHLGTLERVMQSQVLSLEALTNPDMIRAVQLRYEDAQNEHKRLSGEFTAVTGQEQQIAALQMLKATTDPATKTWAYLTRDEKRVIFHTFIQRIEADITDGTGLKLGVRWIDGTVGEVVLPKQMKNGWRTWLKSETDCLLELVEMKAPQVRIASEFPTRTWKQIYDKIAKHCGHGKVFFSIKPMREDETYLVYKERVKENTQPYRAGSSDLWSPEDVEKLLALVDQGATRLQLLEAFPYRRWMSIAKKVQRLRGNDIQLPQDRSIRNHDTIVDYANRMGKQYTPPYNATSEPCSRPYEETCPEVLVIAESSNAAQDGVTFTTEPQSTPDRPDAPRSDCPS